jgi:two-component system sensor histidine kinase TctE
MNNTTSLRARLTMIILIPLLGIAMAVGFWAYRDAQVRAVDRFDRSLLSAVLAISRDTALSGGDALSPQTTALLRDTSGGIVFYHVYAPDGVFVTGYATPPVPPEGLVAAADQQAFFDASYRGGPVRVLRFSDVMTIDGLTGEFNFTVWQDIALRNNVVNSLTQRTFLVISSLLIALTLIVWFGVRIGLHPLLDLQYAIAQRSSDDLTPIRRPVPVEARGIVGTLNALLNELTSTLRAKDDFISNAAHQLRNPIAGVLAMSEAVRSARTLDDAKERSTALVTAARDASELANSLLAFERAKSPKPIESLPIVSLHEVLLQIEAQTSAVAIEQGVELRFDLADHPLHLRADPVLIKEAILNLVTNALIHGGEPLSQITVSADASNHLIKLQVADNGVGMSPDQISVAQSRFVQVKPSVGSGLGLPIAQAVVEGIGGTFEVNAMPNGVNVALVLPRLSERDSVVGDLGGFAAAHTLRNP